MQEKSLESTEIFKIFRGSIPPYPPSVSRLLALAISLFELKSKKAAKVKPIRRHHIREKIEETEENRERERAEEAEDEEMEDEELEDEGTEIECSSSESEDEDSDQEVDNNTSEDVVLAKICDEYKRQRPRDRAELSLGDQR